MCGRTKSKITRYSVLLLCVFVLICFCVTGQRRGRYKQGPTQPEQPLSNAVPPNPPGFLKADLSLMKNSKNGKGWIKLLLDSLPGDEIDEIKDQNITVLYFWDLNPANQVVPSSRIRFYYSVLERTRAGGLREFVSAKPKDGPIEIRQTKGEVKLFDKWVSIVLVPRIEEVVPIKSDDGQGNDLKPARRYFQYFPATVVADKVFAPRRISNATSGALPNLQIWRTALEKSPIREDISQILEIASKTPDTACKTCLEEEKVVAILDHAEFSKYLEDCKLFWAKVREQWGLKQ